MQVTAQIEIKFTSNSDRDSLSSGLVQLKCEIVAQRG